MARGPSKSSPPLWQENQHQQATVCSRMALQPPSYATVVNLKPKSNPLLHPGVISLHFFNVNTFLVHSTRSASLGPPRETSARTLDHPRALAWSDEDEKATFCSTHFKAHPPLPADRSTANGKKSQPPVFQKSSYGRMAAQPQSFTRSLTGSMIRNLRSPFRWAVG